MRYYQAMKTKIAEKAVLNHKAFIQVESANMKNVHGLNIQYCFYHTLFGEIFIAVAEKGICTLAFTAGRSHKSIVSELKKQWEHAAIAEDRSISKLYAGKLFGSGRNEAEAPLKLFLKGTDFQLRVWQAVLQIPPGAVASYSDIAVMIGKPNAARAVAKAVAQNPIGYLIPCHRVVRKSGDAGGYAWGIRRKKALLAWEADTSKKMSHGEIE